MRFDTIRKAFAGLAALFYPGICASCGQELLSDEHVLCLKCMLKLPRTAFHHIAGNRAAQHFIGRVPIERATSFVYFTKQGMMQHLLHRFKYTGRKDIGIFLGMLFAGELKKDHWLDTIDCIIPVPLHSKKQRSRGFNQADILARGLSKVSGIPVGHRALSRAVYTETQTHKTRAERIENVRDVFNLRQPELIKGRHVLLVDDVLTTGATLESCALTLLKAGPASISIATLALAID